MGTVPLMPNRLPAPIILAPPGARGGFFFEPRLEVGGGHVDEGVELPLCLRVGLVKLASERYISVIEKV